MLGRAGRKLQGARINLLGLTFKENVADIRNSKVAELHDELAALGARVHVHDPLADGEQAASEYGIALERWPDLPRADALIVAVRHKEYVERQTGDFLDKLVPGACVLDIKGALDLDAMRRAGHACWRL
jgi:UDP-N-acetyl-D-galactosamine dehydrogenase